MTENTDGGAQSAAAAMAVDFWKLLRVTERALAALPEEKRKRIEAQLRFSASRLEGHLADLDISLATFEGQTFGPELPAVAVNADEFEGAESLIVESAVEPAVLIDGKVIQNARVMLKEDTANVSGN